MAPPFGNGAETPPIAGTTRRSLLAGVAAVGVLGTAGCSRVATAAGVEGGDLLDRLKAQGVVRLGIAGEHTAVPMAVVQLACALVAAACFMALCRPGRPRVAEAAAEGEES